MIYRIRLGYIQWRIYKVSLQANRIYSRHRYCNTKFIFQVTVSSSPCKYCYTNERQLEI